MNPSPAVWVIHAGRGGQDASAFEEAGIVALSLPPVPGLSTMSRDEAIAATLTAIEQTRVHEGHPASSARNLTFASILWRFLQDIRLGDLVLTADSRAAEVLSGVISGEYEMTTSPLVPGYHHMRTVLWKGRVPRSELPKEVLPSISAPGPVYMPAPQAQIASLPLWGAAGIRT